MVFSTNKTDCHDITEILLKVALNTINLKSISKIDKGDNKIVSPIYPFIHIFKMKKKHTITNTFFVPVSINVVVNIHDFLIQVNFYIQ